MFKKLFFALSAAVLCFLLCACGAGGKAEESSTASGDPFAGEWLYTTPDGIYELLTFKGDGNGVKQVLDIPNDLTYTYDDTTLTVLVHMDDPPAQYSYEYRFEGNDMYLKDKATGEEKVFTKQ